MFFMSILVVYIHMYDAQYTDTSFMPERMLEDLFSQGFCRIAVPIFFMISGYLHFSRKEIASKSLMTSFLKKVPSLIIPYFIWNGFYLVYNFTYLILLNKLNTVGNLIEYMLKGLFLYGCNPAFWYVFQLILLFLLSPLLLKIYRNKWFSATFCVTTFVMYLLITNGTKFLLLPGIMFFSLGAVSAIHLRKFIDWHFFSPKAKVFVPFCALVALVLLMVYRFKIMDIGENISDLRDTIPYRLFECLTAICFWFACDVIRLGSFNVKAYEKDSFFIYAIHWFALSIFNIIVNRLIPITPLSRTVIYLLGPIIIVVCILITSICLKKWLPRIYRIISGGRNPHAVRN